MDPQLSIKVINYAAARGEFYNASARGRSLFWYQRRVQQCERPECYRVFSPWMQALAKVLASARYSSR